MWQSFLLFFSFLQDFSPCINDAGRVLRRPLHHIVLPPDDEWLLRAGRRLWRLVPSADDHGRADLGRLVEVVPADGDVVSHLAEVLRAAGAIRQAGVDAEVVNAGLVQAAVVVGFAFSLRNKEASQQLHINK